MADVKWIKITTDMFDNRKIKHLRRLPDGNNIVLIWVMLLTMAGRCNASGMIFLTENIPYTPKMLADELDFEESTVQLALTVLEQLGMVSTDGFLTISSWEEYQNIDKLAEIREQNRLRQAKYKQNQKALADNVTVTLPITLDNATDKETEKIKNKSKKTNGENKDPFSPYKADPNLYQAFMEFVEMRKLMKKPMTVKAKELLLAELGKYPDAEWIPMLNQSVKNNWLSVYPLKEQKQISKLKAACSQPIKEVNNDNLKALLERI